ncbi:Marine sediment metagenome DNA, contig: S12H4_C00178 OS=marine sediment metagenome GN=S12H4_01031 PE=4 SV=1 [Gemmataceae bacterium]|nr:Marine sediment metagenome DNA, contig: S12H4_C00178 OS=marine sediment metagenome GN=S12H4_01031 PE=4 SV=1 [Gemmataceae bacterium]VTU02764.1 Marine sediment metagenome DNA, contig: S12H4_C00178 OS=marine sediment metagenome GN=S12H4_01031 PE=4 SV=1 [Gemmataceae bacterium]
MAAQVRFTQVAEFIEELKRDGAEVQRNIVRVTFREEHQTPLTSVTVIASALVAGCVVTLARRCGGFMFRDGPDAKEVWAAAEKHAELVRTACGELGLEVRAGVYEAVA